MSNKEKHPFLRLTDLIEDYDKNKNSYDAEMLQDLRENISLTLFYLADSASIAVSNYDAADFERKRNYAELIEEHRYDENGNKNTVSVTESLARIYNKEKEEAVIEALRQKKKIDIILSATNQILNAISSRLNMIKQ